MCKWVRWNHLHYKMGNDKIDIEKWVRYEKNPLETESKGKEPHVGMVRWQKPILQTWSNKAVRWGKTHTAEWVRSKTPSSENGSYVAIRTENSLRFQTYSIFLKLPGYRMLRPTNLLSLFSTL